MEKFASAPPQSANDTADKQANPSSNHDTATAATSSAASQSLWAAADVADFDHPYLLAENLPPLGVRQIGEALTTHLWCERGLSNLLLIGPDGRTSFALNGDTAGHFAFLFHSAGLSQPVLICEDWATGARLHLAYDKARTFCALRPDNLEAVAKLIRKTHPDDYLIISGAGGDEWRKAAADAARLIGAELILAKRPPRACAKLGELSGSQEGGEAV